MPTPEPPVFNVSPAQRLRLLRACALVLALLGIALLSPARAPARAANPRRSACPAQAKHPAKHNVRPSRCAKHTSRHSKPVAKKPAKQSHPVKSAPHKSPLTPSQTPALCEDSSAPARTSSGAYVCQDGSEAACEDGSEPVTGPGGAPVCPVVAEAPEDGEDCTAGGGECQSLESNCEDSFDAAEATAACEPSDDGEAAS